MNPVPDNTEFIASELLSATLLARLARLAAGHPLTINGIKLRAPELMGLAEEARLSGQSIRIGPTPAKPRIEVEVERGSPWSSSNGVHHEPGLPLGKGGLNRTHRERVLAHAARRLTGLTRFIEPDEVSRQLRKFLQLEEARLRIACALGAGGLWTARARSFVYDVLIAEVFRLATPAGAGSESRRGADSCAVIALGGYGRRELAPFSDLDLLFLHSGRRDLRAREQTERILHLLWDTGLSVRHSQHTVAECVSAARSDPHLQTALVNMRLVAGNSNYFDRATRTIERDHRKKRELFISAVRSQVHLRQLKFGVAPGLQEPNVKASAGGLRDFHTAMWLAWFRHDCRTLQELRDRDLVTPEQATRVEAAHDFLLNVRQAAHWATVRKTDRLTLDLQSILAEKFGYHTSLQLRGSEQFMRDYYRHARELKLFSDRLLADEDHRPRPLLSQSSKQHLDSIFSIADSQLQFDGDVNLFRNDPMICLSAFALAQAASVSLSPHLREAIKSSLDSIDRNFRTSAAAADAFLALLRRRGRVGHALRLMNETGFLGRYLPEFGRVSLLIQHDLYQQYTIDEHTLRAVEALDRIVDAPDQPALAWLDKVFAEIADVAVLYLAVLVHDLGKGKGSGHALFGARIAKRICERLRLAPADVARVTTLVRHHLLLVHVSQRRDLREVRLATDVAWELGGLDVLNMLLLLTYADMNGGGPGVWTDWKGKLLEELYHRVRACFSKEGTAIDTFAITPQRSHEIWTALQGTVTRSEIENHLTLMPERYSRDLNVATVALHISLIERLGTGLIVCKWQPHDTMATELTICARDRHGLFANLAGALAAQGVEILSADINTRADGFALDTLIVREAATHGTVENPRQIKVERELCLAIRGEIDVAASVERWRTLNAPRRQRRQVRSASRVRITCDNGSTDRATLVEVHAPDEHGLAYKIASSLTACGLDIVCARIATEKSDAFDVFYVTDAEGQKLSREAMLEVEEGLKSSLAG